MNMNPDPQASEAETAEDVELARILDACMAEIEAGRPVDAQRLLADHPALAPRLKACLAGMHLLQQESPALVGVPPGAQPPLPQLGDFRILREIGRGGMGIVYEAEQISLGRRVALKVLPLAATMDARHLQRFLNEARAAAQLHHGNIVPVYAVGSEGGVHYYAMQIIAGRSLDAVVRDLRRDLGLASDPEDDTVLNARPDTQSQGGATESAAGSLSTPSAADPEYFQKVARLGAQAADALEYAHQLGIVHRDIKPANLLVDADQHLWITDFGLAQVRGDSGLTRTGEVVGTLRYMSPEQAVGSRAGVDHRTDIYALGATLYELITLRPIFSGASANELLRQIANEEPVTPRRINLAIPGDLEVIVLKTVAKDRAERYASAQELADDLRRFLDHRPILARRPTIVQHAQKWVRRHRPLVAVAGVASFAVLVSAVIALAFNSLAMAERAKRTKEILELEQAAQKKEIDAKSNLLTVLERERQSEIDAKNRLLAVLERERLTTYYHRIRLAQLAWQDNRIATAEDYLEACRPEEGQRDLRQWEWRYLKRLCAAEFQSLRTSTNYIRSVALSPDGRQVVLLGPNLRVVDANTGKDAFAAPSPPGQFFHRAAFSRDGRLVAAATPNNIVKLMSAKDGKELLTLRGSQIAFSADSTRLLSVDEPPENVCVYDAGTGTPLHSWKCPRITASARDHSWAFSADGTRMAAGANDMSIRVWNAETGVELFALKGHTQDIVCVAFSPDGKLIASLSKDGAVKLWDAERGVAGLTLRAMPAFRACLAFSPDSLRLVLGAEDGSLKFWDIKGQELQVLRGHTAGVLDIAFSADGLVLASVSADVTVKTWHGHGEPKLFLPAGGGAFGIGPGLALHHDGRRAASEGPGRTIKIWDTTTGHVTQQLPTLEQPAVQIMFDRDSPRIFCHAGPSLHVCDLAPEQPWQVLDGPTPALTSVAMSSRGTYAVAALDGSVTIRDCKTRNVIATWKASASYVSNLTFSTNGRLLAGATQDKSLRVWDAATGTEQFACPGHATQGVRIAFRPDGEQLASEDGFGALRLWDARNGKLLLALAAKKKPGTAMAIFASPLAYSPDSQRLAMRGAGGNTAILDASSGLEILTLQGHRGSVADLAYSADGNRLISLGPDGAAIVWDATPVAARHAVPPGKKQAPSPLGPRILLP